MQNLLEGLHDLVVDVAEKAPVDAGSCRCLVELAPGLEGDAQIGVAPHEIDRGRDLGRGLRLLQHLAHDCDLAGHAGGEPAGHIVPDPVVEDVAQDELQDDDRENDDQQRSPEQRSQV